MTSIDIFWVSSHPEKETEISEIFEQTADDIKFKMETISKIGDLPKLNFVKGNQTTVNEQINKLVLLKCPQISDLDYVLSETLDDEFGIIRENEEKLRGVQAEQQIDQDQKIDQICQMMKGIDALNFDREEAMKQVIFKF